MNILLYGDDEQRADYFRRRMDEESYGSDGYKQAQKIFAYLCAKIRAKDKLNQNRVGGM